MKLRFGRLGMRAAAAVAFLLSSAAISAQAPIVMLPSNTAISPYLSEIGEANVQQGNTPKPKRGLPPKLGPSIGAPDRALQPFAGPLVSAVTGANFDGVGANGHAPGDPNIAVGPNHIFEMVNSSYAIYTKTGSRLVGPSPLSSLWAPLGGACSAKNAGDPVVQYDKLADRWLVTQLADLAAPYAQCIGVSLTSDPTGAYYLYSYDFGSTLNDYPKFGVWPTATNSAYVATFNLFSNGATFAGGEFCAYDRTAMLGGAASPSALCYVVSGGGYLPADLDGSTPPVDGTPAYLLSYQTLSSLSGYKLFPNFATPASSTLQSMPAIGVAAFSEACNGLTCIPQLGTSQQLDSLGDRLMYRLAFRNFGDHEALVVNHSVTAGTAVGVRWYELRAPVLSSATFSLYQQGTFAPADSIFRWMGSAAMDKAGDLAIGFSVSGAAIHPAVRYTGRIPTDPLGTLGVEASIIEGGGSQTTSLSRWGDYSSLRIDPVDDCTFWYVNQYLARDGIFNWNTRIASFKFPSCSSAPPVLTTITVSPASASVATSNTQQFTAVGLDQFGTPVSPQPTFTWSVTGGGTISGGGLFTAGAVAGGPFTVTANSGSVNGTASVTVTAPPVLTTITVTPVSASVATGSTQQFTAVGRDQFNTPVSPQPTFTWSVTGVGSINSSGLFSAGTIPGSFTVTASSGGKSGSTSGNVPTPAPDFSLSVNPTSRTVTRGNAATYTVTITPSNGFSGSVTLSLTGQPSRTTVTFSSNPTASTSTLTVTTQSKTTRGTYALAINGTSGNLNRTAQTTLIIQ